MTDLWCVYGVYNAEANAAWRRKHPTDRRPGPREGEVAIEVRGPRSVVDMDRQVLKQRSDIGSVHMGRCSV